MRRPERLAYLIGERKSAAESSWLPTLCAALRSGWLCNPAAALNEKTPPNTARAVGPRRYGRTSGQLKTSLQPHRRRPGCATSLKPLGRPNSRDDADPRWKSSRWQTKEPVHHTHRAGQKSMARWGSASRSLGTGSLARHSPSLRDAARADAARMTSNQIRAPGPRLRLVAEAAEHEQPLRRSSWVSSEVSGRPRAARSASIPAGHQTSRKSSRPLDSDARSIPPPPRTEGVSGDTPTIFVATQSHIRSRQPLSEPSVWPCCYALEHPLKTLL